MYIPALRITISKAIILNSEFRRKLFGCVPHEGWRSIYRTLIACSSANSILFCVQWPLSKRFHFHWRLRQTLASLQLKKRLLSNIRYFLLLNNLLIRLSGRLSLFSYPCIAHGFPELRLYWIYRWTSTLLLPFSTNFTLPTPKSLSISISKVSMANRVYLKTNYNKNARTKYRFMAGLTPSSRSFEFQNPNVLLPDATYKNTALSKLEWRNLNGSSQSLVCHIWHLCLIGNLI